MDFMDARALFFFHRWRLAAQSSQTPHRFRTHSQEELACFKRMLDKHTFRFRWRFNP